MKVDGSKPLDHASRENARSRTVGAWLLLQGPQCDVRDWFVFTSRLPHGRFLVQCLPCAADGRLPSEGMQRKSVHLLGHQPG